MFREIIGNAKQGSLANHIAYAGAITVDPSGNLFIHDGKTAGGQPISVSSTALSATAFTATGAASSAKLADRFSRTRDFVDDWGADNTGATDVTAKLIAAIQYGGRLLVPAGDYLIAATGPSSGGAYCTIKKSLHVICDPSARFFTNGLDHDMIFLSVPSNGTGLPSVGKISVIWEGGYFDQSQQKNSTTYPFSNIYPSQSAQGQGTSNTTDGLSIAGAWMDGSNNYHCGIGLLRITGVRFYSGSHWLTGGGDSNIICSGCDSIYIDCWHQGSRDVAVYSSRDGNSGTAGTNFTIRGTYINCFFGQAFKRSVWHMESHGYFENCVGGVEINWGVGPRPINATVQGLFNGCQRAVRADWAQGVNISGCTVLNMGATLADGITTIDPSIGYPTGMWLRGCNDSRVRGCSFINYNTAYAKGNTQAVVLDAYTDANLPGGTGGTVTTTYCDVSDNIVDGLHSIGQEVSGNADYNRWDRNRAINCDIANVVTSGANTSEIRYNNTAFAEHFTRGILTGDGTSSVAAVARYADPTTGLNFAANTVGIQLSGATVLSATTTYLVSTKAITTPAGNANGPVYTFSAENTLGFYRSATGHIGMTVSGTQTIDLSTASTKSLVPIQFPGYAFASVPSVSANSGNTIRITDRSQRLATSDGTNWRFTDGTIIS